MQCRAIDLGLINYEIAYAFQKKTLEEVELKSASDVIIYCEHPPVITLGRLARKENILSDILNLQKMGIGICYTDRGGDVTLHAPGQLVIYPIFDLKRRIKDVHIFLKNLELVIVNSLKSYGILATIKDGFRGVWVGEDKIASIGIAVKNWITYHGVALNINNDLGYFSNIRPCGLKIRMTSLAEILGNSVNMENIKQIILNNFKTVFKLEIIFYGYCEDNLLGGELVYGASCVT